MDGGLWLSVIGVHGFMDNNLEFHSVDRNFTQTWIIQNFVWQVVSIKSYLLIVHKTKEEEIKLNLKADSEIENPKWVKNKQKTAEFSAILSAFLATSLVQQRRPMAAKH